MVLQIPCPDGRSVFVTSSLQEEQADHEIAAWAAAHGFQLPTQDHAFTLYSPALLTREWRLLERASA
jgi:hypothetical protein